MTMMLGPGLLEGIMDPWPTYSTGIFRVRDLSYEYTGPETSWPQLFRCDSSNDVGPPIRHDVFEYFDPSDGSSDYEEETPLMYTIYSDAASPYPPDLGAYSIRQVAQIQGSCDYFPVSPFDKWQSVGAPTSYGHTLPAVGVTKVMEGIFQFAYNSDLTTIVAQWRVTLSRTRTAP